MGFAAGYGMAILSYVQIFYGCEFGEDIEVKRKLSKSFIFGIEFRFCIEG